MNDFANPSNVPISSTIAMKDYSSETNIDVFTSSNNETIDPTFAPV